VQRRGCGKKGEPALRSHQRRRELQELYVVSDDIGRPLIMLLTEGQMSAFKCARIVFDKLPLVTTLIADQGYNSDHFRNSFVATSKVRELEQRVRELERLLGRRTMEIEFFNEALANAQKKPVCTCGRRHGTLPDEGCSLDAPDQLGYRQNPQTRLGSNPAPSGCLCQTSKMSSSADKNHPMIHT
jgi:transposase